MFTLEVLQAVSDWQRGGDRKQKARRGKRLKEVTRNLDPRFRRCQLAVYRQIALLKGDVWKLIAERTLDEAISSWSLTPSVAKDIKGGVPPEGWQGVVFELVPRPESVVANLHALYCDAAFRDALDQNKGKIIGFVDGAGRYGNSQAEVVLELDSLDYADIHALGGYSSDRDTFIRALFKQEPTPELVGLFDKWLNSAGNALGPKWIAGDSLRNVLKRMEPHVTRLKTKKAEQQTASSA